MPGLPRQLGMVPLAKGLLTKGDKRAKVDDALEVATNVQFDAIGGLEIRLPYGPVNSNIVGGGTLADCRKLAQRGDELLCFTKDALYAWLPSQSAWIKRGDHPAVAVDETTVFAEMGDQIYTDRAELNGTVVYCYALAAGGSAGASNGAVVAAVDKASGAVVQAPLAITVPSGFSGYAATQPKLVALDDCIVVLFRATPASGSSVLCAAKVTLGPFALSASEGLVIFTGTTTNYDAARIAGQTRLYVAAMTSDSAYTVISLDHALAFQSTTIALHGSPAGPIAIAVSPDAAFATVVATGTGGGGGVNADVLNVTPAAAPVTVLRSQVEIGGPLEPVSQIACSYRLTQDGGHYRCYAFWTGGTSTVISGAEGESIDAAFAHFTNWIDDTGTHGDSGGGGVLGAASVFATGLGIAARAFAHDSHVYLWGVFAGLSFADDPTGVHTQPQNACYLYRDDGLLIAKAIWEQAGGFQVAGYLPNVVQDPDDADAFAFLGQIARVVNTGSNATDAPNPFRLSRMNAESAPREVAIHFDDDRARRCVQLGATLYITGGIALQYDGAQITEVGFCVYPWFVDLSNTLVDGAVAAGTYKYKVTPRWNNATGEIERGTTATLASFTQSGTKKIQIATFNLYATRKANVALEFWRSQVNTAAPYFQVSSTDPTATGDNGYVANDTTADFNALAAVTDTEADTQLGGADPSTGFLEFLAPPAASIIATDAQRIYLAGVPGAPNTVWYSQARSAGSVATFNDFLTFDVPTSGGAITAIDFLDGSMVVWCETATYQYTGPGYDNTGGGANWQLARVLSTDLGAVSQECVALYEDGWLVKTSKGWWLLDRGLTYHYVGAGVYRFDGDAVLAMDVLVDRHQVRIVTDERVLVLDNLVDEWAEWSISDGVDATSLGGVHWYLTPTGPRAQLATWDGYDGSDASLVVADVETAWVKPVQGQQQGAAIVDYVQLLGEFRSDCAVRVRIASDYEQTAPGSPDWHTDETWTPYPAVAGSALELRDGLRWNRCAAFKLRYTVQNSDGVSPLAGPCVRLTSLTYQFAVEAEAFNAIAPPQRQ